MLRLANGIALGYTSLKQDRGRRNRLGDSDDQKLFRLIVPEGQVATGARGAAE